MVKQSLLQANWFLGNVGHWFTKNRFLILFPCSLTFVAFRISKASVILLFESYYLVACEQAHLCNLSKIILTAIQQGKMSLFLGP